MKYKEEKMIDCFIRRYKSSRDIITEKSIAVKFIQQHDLSIFKFINRLRKADEEICEKFVKELEK